MTFSWPADIRRLPEARVLALDLPGHGKSGGPGRQSVEAYVQALKEFLDRTDTGRAFLVGHCLGGALALATAVLHPDRVTGLALLSTGARLPVASLILENAANPSTFSLALKALQEASLGPSASPALREANAQRLRAIRQTLLYGDLLACDRFDLTSSVGTIRPPTLAVRDRGPPHSAASLRKPVQADPGRRPADDRRCRAPAAPGAARPARKTDQDVRRLDARVDRGRGPTTSVWLAVPRTGSWPPAAAGWHSGRPGRGG